MLDFFESIHNCRRRQQYEKGRAHPSPHRLAIAGEVKPSMAFTQLGPLQEASCEHTRTLLQNREAAI